MEVFRIIREEYADPLFASGRANRWNFSGEQVLYAAGSRSLACLESVVHSSGEALQEVFNVIVIYIPDSLTIETIHLHELHELRVDWHKTSRPPECQQKGSDWLNSLHSPVLRVPSAIVQEEFNYVLNPAHEAYDQIKVIDRRPFAFDKRIKLPPKA